MATATFLAGLGARVPIGKQRLEQDLRDWDQAAEKDTIPPHLNIGIENHVRERR